MIIYDVFLVQRSLAAGALVPPIDAFLNAFVAEAVAARRDAGLDHGGHTYRALKVFVHRCNLEMYAYMYEGGALIRINEKKATIYC